MTTYECLERAARIEDLAHDVYLRAASAYEPNPPFRTLFQKLAAEEEQHALRIRMLVRHVGTSAWSPEDMARVARSLDEIVPVLRDMAEQVEERVLAESPADVLRWVSDIEVKFAGAHAEALAGCLDPGVRRLFSSLAEQDAVHRVLLERADAWMDGLDDAPRRISPEPPATTATITAPLLTAR